MFPSCFFFHDWTRHCGSDMLRSPGTDNTNRLHVKIACLLSFAAAYTCWSKHSKPLVGQLGRVVAWGRSTCSNFKSLQSGNICTMTCGGFWLLLEVFQYYICYSQFVSLRPNKKKEKGNQLHKLQLTKARFSWSYKLYISGNKKFHNVELKCLFKATRNVD